MVKRKPTLTENLSKIPEIFSGATMTDNERETMAYFVGIETGAGSQEAKKLSDTELKELYTLITS